MHGPFSAAVQAVYDTLKALREGVAPRDLINCATESGCLQGNCQIHCHMVNDPLLTR
jgi:hypothetical protein